MPGASLLLQGQIFILEGKFSSQNFCDENRWVLLLQ